MRKIDSAASRVCATCTCQHAARVMVFRKKRAGNPRRDAHLPRLDDDVLPPAGAGKLGLHRIRAQLALVSGAVAYLQQLARELGGDSLSIRPARLVECFSQLQQLIQTVSSFINCIPTHL